MSLANIDKASLIKILGLIDLTTLSPNDNAESVRALCQKAVTPYGPVACVCTFSEFIPVVKTALNDSAIKIAAVSNFPSGNETIESTIDNISQSIAFGANEIDVVLPWQHFLAGDGEFASRFIQTCKKACGDTALLKVILETGALQTSQAIGEASLLAIDAGADFIKTSTGKISIGATLMAAETMLLAIRHSGKNVGFKASGGIRSIDDAIAYLALAAEIMGTAWVTAEHFRLGASALLDNITAALTTA